MNDLIEVKIRFILERCLWIKKSRVKKKLSKVLRPCNYFKTDRDEASHYKKQISKYVFLFTYGPFLLFGN